MSEPTEKQPFTPLEEKSQPTAPSQSISVSDELATIGADYVKAFMDGDTGLCTLMFFRRHSRPKSMGKGTFQIDAITDELFLEVKIPFNSAANIANFVGAITQKLQANPRYLYGDDGRPRMIFGPSIKSD